jgi:hypothetical protein
LRPGQVHASLGADGDLEYLVGRLRQVWPDVVIAVRGDSAFGVPRLYALCERLGLEYTFGLTANAVLQRHTADLLAQAEAAYAQARQQARQADPPQDADPVRWFNGFWYQAESWEQPRYVVAKVEAHAQGTNRRFVVTNRPGAALYPGPCYDAYVERGESENRNKELKCGLAMDRLSDHRFLANYFRLYLHALAMNLLIRLRRQIADPPALADPPGPPTLPREAQGVAERQQYFRARRQRDPLGEGQPGTWRLLLIKVAAEVIVSVRRVVVRLSSSWPHLGWYQHVCARLSHGSAGTGSG